MIPTPYSHLPSATMVLLAALSAATAASPGCQMVSALESYNTTGRAPEGSDCRTFLTQSARPGVSCSWAFAYRDPAAKDMSDALWATLGACRPGARLAADQTVNHPDSYALRTWAAGGATYRVSLKDKAGEQRTLVFLRFEAP